MLTHPAPHCYLSGYTFSFIHTPAATVLLGDVLASRRRPIPPLHSRTSGTVWLFLLPPHQTWYYVSPVVFVAPWVCLYTHAAILHTSPVFLFLYNPDSPPHVTSPHTTSGSLIQYWFYSFGHLQHFHTVDSLSGYVFVVSIHFTCYHLFVAWWTLHAHTEVGCLFYATLTFNACFTVTHAHYRIHTRLFLTYLHATYWPIPCDTTHNYLYL